MPKGSAKRSTMSLFWAQNQIRIRPKKPNRPEVEAHGLKINPHSPSPEDQGPSLLTAWPSFKPGSNTWPDFRPESKAQVLFNPGSITQPNSRPGPATRSGLKPTPTNLAARPSHVAHQVPGQAPDFVRPGQVHLNRPNHLNQSVQDNFTVFDRSGSFQPWFWRFQNH